MKTYLELVSRYQQANPRKTWLVIFSVALSVALVTTIFSMMDVLQRTEKIQVINETGRYHLMVKNVTAEEMAAIRNRVDVKNAGEWVSFESGMLNGQTCTIAAVEESFAANMHAEVVEGRFPTEPDELMLEPWVLKTFEPPLQIGDRVALRFADGQEHEFVISGLIRDFGTTQAAAKPGVILSMKFAKAIDIRKMSTFLIEFDDRVNVLNARESIQSTLQIPDERIAQNEKLLVVMGQSRLESAIGLYATAAVLFGIVLIAGVVMIYNTFNISVLERVRQFGLLRCIGASKAQIKAIVRREGLRITFRAVPLGLLAGVLITIALSVFLKFFNRTTFAEIPLFIVSLPGMAAGVAVGFLTVLTASFAPANKAAATSPLNAVTGSSETRLSLKKKNGFLTRLFRVDVALGISNAIIRKKTLLLMSASVALSVILFLGFNVFVDFMHTALKTTKPYTPDVSILSDEGLSDELYAKIGALSGVEHVYGRMFGYVDASFDASLLNQSYLDTVGQVQVLENGRFIPVEKSWLISYDADQLLWAKVDLLQGTLDETALNEGNGIVAVVTNLRNNITSHPVNWHIGDRVTIETPDGPQEKTVMAILRTVPFGDSNLNMTTFVTTEKQFTELTGDSTFDVIDVQLKNQNQEATITEIRTMLNGVMTLHDSRQKNKEIDQIFFSVALFVYGFVAVIALISVLNVMNTIHTSVAAKTRYLGVMRAVGMTEKQLRGMILSEVGTYNLLGCLIGIGLGLPLQKILVMDLLNFAHIDWHLPLAQLVLILAVIVVITAAATIQPLRQIRSRSITDVIGSL